MVSPLLHPVCQYRLHLARGRLKRLRSGGVHVWFILGFGTACIIHFAPEKKARSEKCRWKSHRGCLTSQMWHSKPLHDPSARESRNPTASDSDHY